jgi:hypothetical protein
VIDRYRECGRPDKGSGVSSYGVAMEIGVVTVSMVIRSRGVVRDVVCYCRPTADIYVVVYCSKIVDTMLDISVSRVEPILLKAEEGDRL